ncbi:MAG: alpha/beta hydrolase [Pedobacter sp.]|nr:alpha/beta hydrolase [Pedobacter sp.]MDQ8053895.1 alpha/beta hydrolase [Pedobacter sp.]
MISIDHHQIIGSNNRPILIDVTIDQKQPDAPLVIFVHGFKGFKDWGAHHLTAHYFAQNGYRYLKFNLSHSGVDPDHPTDVNDLDVFASNTFSKELLDVDLVIDYALKNLNVGKVILIGHSRGGGLGIITAANHPKVRALITWSSIADFSSLWRREQEATWRREGKIYVVNARTKEKMPLNITLLDDFEANSKQLNILDAASRIDVPWLIVHGDNDVNVPFEVAQKLANTNPKSRLVEIKDANHVFGASHPYLGETLPPKLFQVCKKSIRFLHEL